MRILITGTAGRIGAAIYQLLSQRHDLTGLDVIEGDYVDIQCDVSAIASYGSLLKDVDVIIHSAALHAPHVGERSDEDFQRINVDATETLARCAFETEVKHFIFTSTTALYGYASNLPDKAAWIDENTSPLPKTIYHCTKLDAEKRLEKISQTYNKPVTVLRMSRCFPEPVNLMAIYRLHRGIDKRDVALAHKAAMENRLSGFRKFVISYPGPFTIDDVKDLKQNPGKVLQRTVPAITDLFKTNKWQLPDSIDRVYDSRLAISELGWRPEFAVDEVVKQGRMQSSEVLPPELS